MICTAKKQKEADTSKCGLQGQEPKCTLLQAYASNDFDRAAAHAGNNYIHHAIYQAHFCFSHTFIETSLDTSNMAESIMCMECLADFTCHKLREIKMHVLITSLTHNINQRSIRSKRTLIRSLLDNTAIAHYGWIRKHCSITPQCHMQIQQNKHTQIHTLQNALLHEVLIIQVNAVVRWCCSYFVVCDGLTANEKKKEKHRLAIRTISTLLRTWAQIV